MGHREEQQRVCPISEYGEKGRHTDEDYGKSHNRPQYTYHALKALSGLSQITPARWKMPV